VNAPFYLRLIADRRLSGARQPELLPGARLAQHQRRPPGRALAAGLGARRLLLMTDVPGVRGSDGSTLDTVTLSEMRNLVGQE